MSAPSALFVSAEIYPVSKTGGLADVSADLPKALTALGADMRALTPAYGDAAERYGARRVVMSLPPLAGFGPSEIREAPRAGGYLLFAPDAFGRAGGPYQSAEGRDWPDNARRFALLSHAAARFAADGDADWRPEILHCNDWHAGLAPAFLAAGGPATVFTIHNAAFQGLFDAEEAEGLGVHAALAAKIALHGRLSALKAGAVFADAVTTVSRRFTQEIMTPAFGFGLETSLAARKDPVRGILNGVDSQRWNPRNDALIPAGFSADDLAGKAICKRAALRRAGFDETAPGPLVVVLSRITTQKMSDVVAEAAPRLLALDPNLRIALCGEGDAALEARLAEASAAEPRFAAPLPYSEEAAHLFLAGADILLHPSRFEPCGLTPIYAKRYGAAPVATRVGGHIDTIRDVGEDPERGDGFLFDGERPADLAAGLERALRHAGEPTRWRRLMSNGMTAQVDWTEPASMYMALYRSLIARRGRR